MAAKAVTAKSTTDLASSLKSGKLKKSADRKSLLDEQGNVVATRVASSGDRDYYADANQQFAADCIKICLCWECGEGHNGGKICLCVEWGCHE